MTLRPTGTDPRTIRPADMLPIEKGVPQPAGLSRGLVVNTLRAMDPGDSFVISRKCLSNVYARAKRLGIKVRAAPLADGRARVWRIK
jgi:hypothetical protein